MVAGGQFDKKSAQRIVNVVKYVEKQIPKTELKYNRAKSATLSNSGFWAIITDADDETGKYGWTKLRPQAESEFNLYDSPFIQDSTYGTASTEDETGYAREATGSTEVVMYDIVWIEPNGVYDYYTFLYRPLPKWVKNQDEIDAVDDDDEDEEEFSFSICDVYQFEKISETKVKSTVTAEPAITLNAYNPSLSAIPADTYLKVCFMAGRWFVDLQRCE